MEIEAVGRVESTIRGKGDVRSKRDDVARVVVYDRYAELLHRIEEHEELDIIFRFHKLDEWRATARPFGDPSNPEYGTFATRSPFRPNFLGVTRVRLVGREGNVLLVRGLDAFDGSPVIDIKPSGWPPERFKDLARD